MVRVVNALDIVIILSYRITVSKTPATIFIAANNVDIDFVIEAKRRYKGSPVFNYFLSLHG